MFISACGPISEEEIEEFWSELSESVRSFGKNESVVVLGHLNAKVGNEAIEGIAEQHGMPGRNESGEQLLKMCAEHLPEAFPQRVFRLTPGNTGLPMVGFFVSLTATCVTRCYPVAIETRLLCYPH